MWKTGEIMLMTHLSSPYEPSGNDSGCWGPTHPPFKVRKHAFPLSRQELLSVKQGGMGQQSSWPGHSALEPVDLPHPLLTDILGLPLPHFLSFKAFLLPL